MPGGLVKAESTEAPAPAAAAPSNRKAETQERILAAAMALFAERGFEGASISAIAAAARVSRATIFWHFGDKATLFQESCRRMLLPFIDEFRKSLEHVDARKRVLEFFSVYEGFVSQYLTTIETFVRWALESRTLRSALQKPLFALHDQFVRDIRQAFLELWGDPGEASELATAFIAMMDGNLLLGLMETSAHNRELRAAGLRRVAELVLEARSRY
jgi:AcrR family transcriptional regulator